MHFTYISILFFFFYRLGNRLREVKSLTQSCVFGEWLRPDRNPLSLFVHGNEVAHSTPSQHRLNIAVIVPLFGRVWYESSTVHGEIGRCMPSACSGPLVPPAAGGAATSGLDMAPALPELVFPQRRHTLV